MCGSSRCRCYNSISNMPATPYIGNIDLPAVSPYPSPPWTHPQLPAVQGYNRHYNPYPTPSPTLPGTPMRLPITPNSPSAPLPSSPRTRIDSSLVNGRYDASNDYNMLSDKYLLNPAIDRATSSLVLVLPPDLNVREIVVTPTTSSPYITVFDIVMAIRKALYAPSQSQLRGTPGRGRVVDSLRGRTRISVWVGQSGPRPVLGVEFS